MPDHSSKFFDFIITMVEIVIDIVINILD